MKSELIVNVVYSFVKTVSYCFLGHLFFSQNCSKCTFLKYSITTNKFCFTRDFDITYPPTNALVHFSINMFCICCTPKSKVQPWVSAYLKAPIHKGTKHLFKDMLYKN